MIRSRLLALLLGTGLVTPVFAAPALATETTLQRAPEPAQQAIEAARAKANDGDVQGAITILTGYLSIDPNALDAMRALGDFYYRVPDLANAERMYRAILKRRPDDKETHNRLGGIYAAQDRIDEALGEFEKSLPEAGGFQGLVAAHQRRGDLAAFEAQLALVTERAPLDPRGFSNYGNVLRAERKFDAATVAFKRELALRPNNCIALNDLANAYLDTAQVDAAQPLLKTCLAIEPQNYPALVNSGEAFIELGAYDAARPLLDKAVKAAPDRPEAFVDLGYLEDVAQKWKSAITLYQQAISVDPLARDAYVNLGYDYNEHRLFSQAEAAFIRGLSVSPRDGRLQYMLGVTYSQQGKTALARAQYENAIKSDEAIVVRAAKAELAALDTTRNG